MLAKYVKLSHNNILKINKHWVKDDNLLFIEICPAILLMTSIKELEPLTNLPPVA